MATFTMPAGRGAAATIERPKPPFEDGDTVTVVFENAEDAQRKTYDTRNLADDAAEFELIWKLRFRVLTADGDPTSGHGWVIHKNVRRPRVFDHPREGGKPSAAYTLFSRMLGGKDTMDDETLVNAFERLSTAITEGGQFVAVLKVNEETRWVDIDRVLRPLAKNKWLPAYVAPDDSTDPRIAHDNPKVRCSVTGKPLVGWVLGRGTPDEKWVSNEEWAEMQVRKFGTHSFTFDGVDGTFTAPFGKEYYSLAKAQFEQAERERVAKLRAK